MSKVNICVIIILIGCLADALSTLHGIKAGLFYEVNPLMNALITISETWFLVVKLGLTSIAAWFLRKMYIKGHESALYILATAGIIYIVLSAWHIILIARIA